MCPLSFVCFYSPAFSPLGLIYVALSWLKLSAVIPGVNLTQNRKHDWESCVTSLHSEHRIVIL